MVCDGLLDVTLTFTSSLFPSAPALYSLLPQERLHTTVTLLLISAHTATPASLPIGKPMKSYQFTGLHERRLP